MAEVGVKVSSPPSAPGVSESASGTFTPNSVTEPVAFTSAPSSVTASIGVVAAAALTAFSS